MIGSGVIERITHAQQQNVDSLGAQRQRAVMNLPRPLPLPAMRWVKAE
jgi:hypothetical protein